MAAVCGKEDTIMANTNTKNAPRGTKIKESFGSRLFDIVDILIVCLLLACVLIPLVHIVAASFSNPSLFVGHKGILLWPEGFSLASYQAVFKNAFLWTGYANTLFIVLVGTVLNVLLSMVAAYCLSRFRFFGNQAFQKMILTGLSIPSIMIVMPLCSIISALNMSGSRFTMIFLYTATSVPYTTYFLMTFFKGISNTYAEAATIDGCGQVQCFWRIMFPLAQPAVVTVTIFNFITIWNEYFLALVFANKTELRSLGVGLYQIVYSLMNTGDWAGLFAAVVITFVPTVVIYIFLADKIISGVTAGGIKG